MDVQFLQNENIDIFAKKILITAITKSFKIFNKEIIFTYPDKKVYNECEDDFKTFGNIELSKKEAELSKVLGHFGTIIVSSKTKRDFIENYLNSKSRIIIIGKPEIVANEYNRYCELPKRDSEE